MRELLSAALAFPCRDGEGYGLAASALFEISMQGESAFEKLEGGGCVVAGERDLREGVESGLLLGRGAGGLDALQSCRGGGQIAKMHLADTGIKLSGAGIPARERDVGERSKSRAAVACRIALHTRREVCVFAFSAKS